MNLELRTLKWRLEHPKEFSGLTAQTPCERKADFKRAKAQKLRKLRNETKSGQFTSLHAQGLTPKQISEIVGYSIHTTYKYLKIAGLKPIHKNTKMIDKFIS